MSATSERAAQEPLSGNPSPSKGYGRTRMREAEIQHKRISFQLIRETHGLIRVLLDNLGRAFCLSGLFCCSLHNWADIPLSR